MMVSSGGSSSAMTTSHGHGYFDGHGLGPSDCCSHRGRGHGRGHASCGGSSNMGGDSSSNNSTHPQCQICGKVGHMAKACWYYYDDDIPDQHTAAMTSFSADPNWYTDSGATDHITEDLDKLIMHDTYLIQDQIHAANGSSMKINHIGNSIIPTSGYDLVLTNVLHVSFNHKNLISIYRFTLDNDTFIESQPYGSKNKECATARTM
jgi:hypothetical protein